MSPDSPESKALQSLSQLGFTDYEAKTYLAMLKSSPVTGYQISKEAGIPRSMVYEALGRLTNRGAVMSHSTGDVTHYAPLPVNSLLDNLRHEYEDAIDAAHDQLESFQGLTPYDEVWSIEGHQAVLSRAQEMILSSRSEILISVGDSVLVQLMSQLSTASIAGVSIRFLLLGDADVPFGEVARHPHMESAAQSIAGSLVLVVDNSLCLIGSSGTRESAIWTGSGQVVFIARQYILQEMLTQKILERLRTQGDAALTLSEYEAILGAPKKND
jgi:sugar-specific transcriptional regulator TrmB